MTDLLADLAEVETKARAVHAQCDTNAVRNSIKKLIDAAHKAEVAHSGSWIGYHSCVYYGGLKRPPTGAFFDKQFGLLGLHSSATAGDWVQHNYAMPRARRRTPSVP
jgi:hypothetical protein